MRTSHRKQGIVEESLLETSSLKIGSPLLSLLTKNTYLHFQHLAEWSFHFFR
jgi:hypothetical protein